MEVTPLDLRGLHVSSGDGATPHGRDMSPPKQIEEPRPNVDDRKSEIPVDLAVAGIETLLRLAAPTMSPGQAQQIAKTLLTRKSEWDSQQNGQSGTQVDVQA